MRALVSIESVQTPDGLFELKQRGEKDFFLTLNGRVVMTSAAHRSEDALASLACRGLQERPRARVLVSGLGMGFTLRAALSELAADAHVDVAELNAVTLAWCRGPLAVLTQGAVADERVTAEVIDVTRKIASVAADPKSPRYDAILLDMYEGPQSVVPAHDKLYGAPAMARARDALVPGGVLAVWCEARSRGFEASLRQAGFTSELHRAGHGARVHFIYLATSRAAPVRPRAPRRSP